MATIYKRENGNWVEADINAAFKSGFSPVTIVRGGSYQISYDSVSKNISTQSASGTYLYQIEASTSDRTIKVKYTPNNTITYFTSDTNSYANLSQGATIIKQDSTNGVDIVFVPANKRLIFTYYYTLSQSRYYWYRGFQPSSVSVIKILHQYNGSCSYTTKGIFLSGTYISSVSDSNLPTRAARVWEKIGAGTYIVVLNGDWTIISQNGWDFYSATSVNSGYYSSATTKTDINYDSITNKTTMKVTLTSVSNLIFARQSDITDAESVLNSINPSIIREGWS